MAWKQTGQLSLADSLIVKHKAIEELDDLHDLIDWQRIEHQLRHVHNSEKGESAFHPVIMFKILLLQKLYGLSDPAMEKQLARDLLFRRFVGLSLTDSVPDHSTIWRFHKMLGETKLIESLFNEIGKQLNEKNIIIKLGSVSIIDASIVEAKNKRKQKGKNTDNTQDSEAGCFTKKNSQGKTTTTFGYKMHLNVDGDGFVKKVKTTPANIHDSQCFIDLLIGDESAVYADKAYKSQAHDDYLTKLEIPIANHIHERAWRNRPLSEAQTKINSQKSQTRNTVERVFGHLKLDYGMTKARHLGLMQFHTSTVLASIAHNLKTALGLKIRGLI